MSEPYRFLTSLAQTLATMSLYREGHPARERAMEGSYRHLEALQTHDSKPSFSFLGGEVIYREQPIRELKDWEPARRLANGGVQRLEFEEQIGREEFQLFLDEVLARVTASAADSAEMRPGRSSRIKFGAIGLRGESRALQQAIEEPLTTASLALSLVEEAETVRWMHEEVGSRGTLPLLEAETVVRSLSVAMHGESRMVIPLLQLREFDEYTTTHSLNVSVLTMALAEYLGMAPHDVRAFGTSGLLHDLGKVRIPIDILNKPGRLTDEERAIMQQHPVDGARLILATEHRLDLAAAVAFEHHIMIDGGGYPCRHFRRECHSASKLVHVCDVFDALRTRRPYRDAWETERALTYIEERAGIEFDPSLARNFVQMMRQWERRTAVMHSGSDEGGVPMEAAVSASSTTP